jgi:hypothetical protein
VVRFKSYMILFILYSAANCGAQIRYTVNPSEYQVKAKFLYSFARFVKWPDDKFADKNTPITIAIVGNDPFGIDIDKTVEGKRINGRRIEIRHSQNVNIPECCHILFIGVDEEGEMAEILNRVKDKSVLTVGETEGFLQAGGILNFIIRDNKVHFNINPDAANRSGLWISAQLLKLASLYSTQS